jgi:hypothetical protein
MYSLAMEIDEMPNGATNLVNTVMAMRPIIPARNFAISRRFYGDLGFQPRALTDALVEMCLADHSFILQDYYVQQWAGNCVMHPLVGSCREARAAIALRCEDVAAKTGKLGSCCRRH